MSWVNSDLLFLPVGGSEEIGMNANLYHYQDKWILVDLGISFPDETDLGIDVLLPDFDFIQSLGDKFLGILLTHGHEDHIGAIPYFADKINCPIWGTAFTIALLKRKLKESNNNTKLVLNVLSIGEKLKLGDFIINTIQTSHSIPDPVSFLISTKEGNIFHSGDWKLEQAKNLNENFDFDTYRSLGNNGVLAMVCDSTNSLVNGRTPSEDFAYEGLYRVIKEKQGAVLITCFSSNISRIKSILDIALKTDRSILVIGRSLLRAIDAAKEVGYLKNVPDFLNLKDFNVISRSNVLVIATGSQGEPNSALSRISRNADKYVNLIKGDTMVDKLNLKALFILFALVSFVVVAQEDSSENDEEADDDNIEEVITLGSRIARNPLELAQPVTIISGEEYAKRAYTNAAQALTDVPGVGSVNSLSGDQGGLGAGQQVASNFGLGSSRTVTLVNGRRFVGSQSPTAGAGSGLAVDLNNVPSALIERVEILPVGGAAIYGADAIARVVNFVLKDDLLYILVYI